MHVLGSKYRDTILVSCPSVALKHFFAYVLVQLLAWQRNYLFLNEAQNTSVGKKMKLRTSLAVFRELFVRMYQRVFVLIMYMWI